MEQLKKKIYQMSAVLAPLIALALVGYISYMVVAQYRTQTAIQDGALKQLTSDSTRRATALSYFFNERRGDLKELAQSRELTAYFENQALGMSMEYGLRASLILLDDLLTKVRSSHQLEGQPVFDRLAFVDRSGVVLADTLDGQASGVSRCKSPYPKNGKQGAMTIVKENGERQILLSWPAIFKNQYVGEMLGWVSPSRISHYFIEGNTRASQFPMALIYNRTYLTIPDKAKELLGADAEIPSDLVPLAPYQLRPATGTTRAGGYAIMVPVDGAPLSLMAVFPGAQMLDMNAPRRILYTTGGIAVLILLGLFYLQRINTRNAVLQVHLAETTLREAAVDEKNRLLAAEIEERRQTEAALRESEIWFRGIVGAVPVVIYQFRQSGANRSFSFVSEKIFELAGITSAEMMADANAFLDLIHPEDRDAVLAATELSVATVSGFRQEFRLVKPDGETRWVVTNSLPERGTDNSFAWYGCIEDITDHKQADLALWESRQQLLDIIAFLPDPTLVVDREGKVLAWNNAIEVMTGVKADEMIGKGDYEYALPFYGTRRPILIDLALHPDNPDNPDNAGRGYAGLWTDGDVTYGEAFTPNVGAHGLHIACSASVLRNSKGEVTAAIECIRDQSERIRAEQLLRESEATLRSVLDSMPAGVWWYNDAGEVEYLNSRFAEIFGYPIEEISTLRNWLRLVYPDEAVRKSLIVTRARAIAEAKQNGSAVPPLETMMTCRDGRQRHVIVNTQLANGRILEIFTDITEQEFIHNELLKVQKMESLGVLAGGIAHDFNNILTGILGNISLVQMMLGEDDKVSGLLKSAESASYRASELAHQLLTFAKGGQPIKKVVSIPRLVQESLSLSLRGSKVQGITQWHSGLFDIVADAGQMSQVFNNVIINAVHAMRSGGTLTITGDNIQMEQGNKLSLSPGPYVKLQFEDQGCGIPEADLKNIFDPYFTTKSGGNGLGLASTLSIIRKHGGHIQVQSEVGVGTTFSFYLPATVESAAAQENAAAKVPKEQRHSGSILVMDDEEMVRELSAQILSHLGYQVTTCADGAEAVALYRDAKTAGKPFFSVIMDLTVPGGMGGREAAEKILAYDPAAKLIVSSGYSNDKTLSQAREYGFKAAVVKPYKASDLDQALSALQAA